MTERSWGFGVSAPVSVRSRCSPGIKGNKYRVVVAVKFQFHVVHIEFIGTHAEYDRIDAATVGG